MKITNTFLERKILFKLRLNLPKNFALLSLNNEFYSSAIFF